MITWFLIAYLAGGGIASITEVDGPAACVQQGTFIQRFDPKIKSTYCMLSVASLEV